MDYNILKKSIKFKDRNGSVEIFCKKQYKNYYLRGVAYELIADIADTEIFEDLDDDIDPGTAYYKAIILALVNDDYQKKAKENTSIHYFHMFKGNTKEDFLNSSINHYIRPYSCSEKFIKEIYESYEKSTLIINLEDANIIENSYLNESINLKQDIILLSIHIIFDRIKSTTYDLFKERYPKKNYPLLAYYFSKNADPKLVRFSFQELVYFFIFGLYETLYYGFGYEYLDEKKYYKMLEDTGNVCLEWLNQQKITKSYLNSLNSFKNCQTSDADPLTRFCNNFFYELIDDLKNQKMIKECEFCGDFFGYVNNKKYCSILLEYENKNCRKQAADRRRYLKIKYKNLRK